MNPTLSPAQTKRIYDRMGRLQDTQWMYEDRARDRMLESAALGEAGSVIEFGAGTGRFADQMLADLLPPDARYLGLDVSTTMVGHARRRLAPYGGRAEVILTEGGVQLPAEIASFDRFVSTYVLDLLSAEDIRALLTEAHRVLKPTGRLCLVSASPGRSGVQRAVMGTVSAIHRVHPGLIAGCQPIELMPFVDPAEFKVQLHTFDAWCGIASEILVAERVA
jgi:ubiquinone/menaquinone biosynthesis C-methylase UbiE